MWSIIKKIIFWSYGRTTWQYDVLCVLILAFVFLTPKSWFARGELNTPQAHHNVTAGAKKLLLSPENLGQNPGAQEILRGAQVAIADPDVRVKGWREVLGADGQTVAYEIDIE